MRKLLVKKKLVVNSTNKKDSIDKTLEVIAFSLGFFASIPLVRVATISLYVWLMVIATLALIISCRLKFRFTPFHFVWFSAIITFVLNQSILPKSWGQNNFNGFIAITLVALVADTLFSGSNRARLYIKGVLAASKIQIIWIIIQFITYKLLSIDINQFIFNTLLGMTETTSQYKATGLTPSGLCWNAGGIAAALLAQFALGDKGYWRVLCVVAGLLTQSSTLFIGLTMLLIFKACLLFKKRHEAIISKSALVTIGGFVIVVASALICVPAFASAVETVIRSLIDRLMMLFGLSTYDSSFDAHLSYYTNLPLLVDKMDFTQILFGYGIDCSGLPYSDLTSQYWWMESWFLESDPMNSFLGMGLIGLVSIYLFLFSTVKKTWVTNRITSLLILTFIGCGFFYDLQSVLYYWLFMFEIALSRQNCPNTQ